MAFDSRRIDPEGMTFVFKAQQSGTYELKFCRQDFIRDYVMNDHVKVIVSETPAQGGKVTAPRWPAGIGTENVKEAAVPPEAEPVKEADKTKAPAPKAEPAKAAKTPGAATTTAAITPAEKAPAPAISAIVPPAKNAALPPETLPEEYIKKASAQFKAGHIPETLDILRQYKNRFPLGSDEAWWLFGQAYEADTPSRDINQAMAFYQRLVNEYPQSSHYADARRRINYLNRYYFNIQ
jgi:TolA-binding protein